MADAGNKAGEVFVEIKADTKPLDATLAALPGKAAAAAQAASQSFVMGPSVGSSTMTTGPSGTGLGGASAPAAAVAAIAPAATKATGAMGSLLAVGKEVKSVLSKLFIPVAVAFGIVKIITHLDEMKAAALRANDALSNVGRDFREGVNSRAALRLAEKADAEKGGFGTAVKEVQIAQRKKDALVKVEEELAKRRSDIQGRSAAAIVAENPGSTESIASIRARQMVEAEKTAQEQRNQIEADSALEIKHTREDAAEAEAKDKKDKQQKETNELVKMETDRAKRAAEAAVEAENQAKLAGLTGNDAVREKLRQDEEALDAARDAAGIMAEGERESIERKRAALKTIAAAEIAENDKVAAAKKKLEDEDVARRKKNEADVSRAAQQAIVDFNTTARNSLNDLLNTAGIQTGMDKIANILLAIKGSQGGI